MQGDKLRDLKMEATPLDDHNQHNGPRSQVDFITLFHLRDAFSALAVIAPTFGEMATAHLDANVARYTQMVEERVTTSTA
jgi:hypothetical protein